MTIRELTFWRKRLAAYKWRSMHYDNNLSGDVLNAPTDLDVPAFLRKQTDIDAALSVIIAEEKASTSLLQRRLSIGYNKAADLMCELEKNGYVSEPDHRGRRQLSPNVLVRSPEIKHGDFQEHVIDWGLFASDRNVPVSNVHRRREDRAVLAVTFASSFIGRVSRSLINVQSFQEPKLHVLIICFSTALFALGHFFGGISLLAYSVFLLTSNGGGKS